jgi:hypothetical protein
METIALDAALRWHDGLLGELPKRRDWPAEIGAAV